MAHADTTPDTISRISVDPREMKSFARMAEDWWNPDGMFKPLHVMNGARMNFIKRAICDHFDRDPDSARPLEGLRILDIGCGGGLLSEPVTRLGADVTGVDALEKNLKTAKTHAESVGLDIDYRHGTVEQLAERVDAGDEPRFDAVLNMEVIEHVNDPAQFIADCARTVRPGGMMVCSTINRTTKAFLFAIVGAEYVLGWLPKGTHQYAKLVRPAELRRWIVDAGMSVEDQTGMSLNPITNRWRLSGDMAINYVTVATKANEA